MSDKEQGGGDIPSSKGIFRRKAKPKGTTTKKKHLPGKPTTHGKKKKEKFPPKLKDVLCRSLLITSKNKRPATVPFMAMNRGDKYVLRGKFLPKGCHILDEKLPPSASGFQPENPSESLFATSASLRTKKICLAGCRYEVLPVVAAELGFKLVGEEDLWNINWSDCALASEKIMQMRRVQDMYSVFWGVSTPLQRTNHFPGMYEICRKDRLGRNLKRLRKMFPNEFNFFPETWDLPTEQSDLVTFARARKNATYIIKPESGCQGKGIFLMKNPKALRPFAKCVCQFYIPHPLLIDGYKFDQRIYVLITSVDPLRLYVYDEGIARFATVKYEVPTEENLEVTFMHLTNYSINKFSESYVKEGDGSKRKLTSVYGWMIENGYDVHRLIKRIDDIVVKTILCAVPTLKHNYKTSFPRKDRACSCFELLGFDILIDRHLNPFLLEVNHSPSFNLDLPVDTEVKTGLLKDLLNMVYLGPELTSQDLSAEQKLENSSSTLQGPPLNILFSPKGKRKKNRKTKSSKKIEEQFAPEIDEKKEISGALLKQFQHELKNRGKFRLVYSSDKPGDYIKLAYDTNVRYNGLAAMSWIQPVPQVKRRILAPTIFEPNHKDEWQMQRTSSVVKMTKTGQMYLETRVVNPNNPTPIAGSSKKVQKYKYPRMKDPEVDRSRYHPNQHGKSHHASATTSSKLKTITAKTKTKRSSKSRADSPPTRTRSRKRKS